MASRYLNALLALCTSVFLLACNGSSGSNGEDPFNPDQPPPDDTPSFSLSLSLLESTCTSPSSASVPLGTEFCIQALLSDQNGPVSGEIVRYTADIGELSSATKLTNASGIAEINLSSVNANIGAGSIEAVFGGQSISTNFEFTGLPEQEPDPLPSMTIAITDLQGNLINRFSNVAPANISAQLIDGEGIALQNKIISFQVSNGDLSVSQALTDENGIARTQIDPSNANFGAGTITATSNLDDTALDASINFEIFESTQNQTQIRFGHFDQDVFIENQLGISSFASDAEISISAGATIGIFVDVVDENDQIVTSNIPISFTSSCFEQGATSLDENVTTINGRANATYEDLSCATGSGNQDTISASVFVDGTQVNINRLINIQPESAGSIEFLSATPSNIVLQGTGGQGSASVSLVSFQVTGAQGNALAQQEVTFSLNTEAGGLSLSPSSGLTNSEGQVSTRVTAGNVPTSVRVTAQVSNSQEQTIQTQSDLLSVNTGLPDQNSMSLSANNLNPEAFNIDGQEVSIIARLADTFNNPVPDGTSVSFTSEGGIIEPSCTTVSGACSVTWTSSSPRTDDHRITILATAIGHETLIDSNGNNVYDDEDGAAILDDDGSGFEVTLGNRAGFIDLSEAFRDDNENRILDVNEIFLDFNSSGSFDDQNLQFDGPQCIASNCAATSLHVRKALVLVTSSSRALISVETQETEIANNSSAPSNQALLDIQRGDSTIFTLNYSDTAGQAISSGSIISVVASEGDLSGTTNDTMPITNANSVRSSTFTLTNNLADADEAINSIISITIQSPSGVQSSLSFAVSLE